MINKLNCAGCGPKHKAGKMQKAAAARPKLGLKAKLNCAGCAPKHAGKNLNKVG